MLRLFRCARYNLRNWSLVISIKIKTALQLENIQDRNNQPKPNFLYVLFYAFDIITCSSIYLYFVTLIDEQRNIDFYSSFYSSLFKRIGRSITFYCWLCIGNLQFHIFGSLCHDGLITLESYDYVHSLFQESCRITKQKLRDIERSEERRVGKEGRSRRSRET